MTNKPSLQQINEAIATVMHPAIDLSLTELGIIQDIALYENTVILTFVFPFPEIPIKDKLIYLVEDKVHQMGMTMEYIIRTMKTGEKQRFLEMEKIAWKGSPSAKSCGT